jgi:hypothetical protein
MSALLRQIDASHLPAAAGTPAFVATAQKPNPTRD